MRSFLTLVLAVALAATARGEEFNPYEIPTAQFTAQVHTIALRPVRVLPEVGDPTAVRERIETRIADALRTKGYGVVPPAAFAALWRQMSEKLGGTFDPLTGATRKDVYEAARDHVGRELKRLYQADAVLTAWVGIEWAPFYRGGLTYQAMNESLRWQGEPFSSALINHPQQVRGAYLNVVIDDLGGMTLYSVRVPIEWIVIYAARGYEEKPIAQRLVTPGAVENAADKALGMLVSAAGSAAPH